MAAKDEKTDQVQTRTGVTANLPLHPPTEFRPGVSGNPNGRPPNQGSVSYWIKQLAGLPEGKSRENRAQVIAKKLHELARAGNLKAIEQVLDRVDGKAPQPIVGDKDNPITVAFIEIPADKPSDAP